MSNLLEKYRGLSVPATTPGEGGRAIKENFQTIADWIAPETIVQPTDDAEANAAALREAYMQAKRKLQMAVTGSLTPAVTGTYAGAGTYNDQPFYTQDVSGATWYLYWDGSSKWRLSSQLGSAGADYWERTGSGIDGGTYTPGGDASGDATVGISNRAAVRVGAGQYDLGQSIFVLDTNCVDVIGEGICRCVDYDDSDGLLMPTVVLTGSDLYVVQVTCRDVLLRGFHLIQEQDTPAYKGLVIDNDTYYGDLARFVDIGVTMVSTTRPAVAGGTEDTVAAYFEQVHTKAKNLGVGVFAAICKHCTGGPGSFHSENASS
jgi:hypothetical protein